jgi:hypothetical protein
MWSGIRQYQQDSLDQNAGWSDFSALENRRGTREGLALHSPEPQKLMVLLNNAASAARSCRLQLHFDAALGRRLSLQFARLLAGLNE